MCIAVGPIETLAACSAMSSRGILLLESRAMPEVAVLESRNTTVWPSRRGMATMASSCVSLHRFRNGYNGCNGCDSRNFMG
jgi:hypothetical protein